MDWVGNRRHGTQTGKAATLKPWWSVGSTPTRATGERISQGFHRPGSSAGEQDSYKVEVAGSIPARGIGFFGDNRIPVGKRPVPWSVGS